MSESVTSVDINFSNGGGGHTASVTTTRGSMNPDGTESLGSVEDGDEFGQRSSFSDQRVDKLLRHFRLVETTVVKGETVTTATRKYADKTSLALNSYIVLVRGVNATPRRKINEKDQHGNPKLIDIPYFSEVINSPDMMNFPFEKLGPVPHKAAIVAGRIFNYETPANPNGVKISLVYNNKELQDGTDGTPDLCLNDELVQDSYKGSREGEPFGTGPDLSQYDLKFGYTLTDFLGMLAIAKVKAEGLPRAEGLETLFEISGSLASVVSGIASYFGLYWWIDPDTGNIKFISSKAAREMPINDPTDEKNADEMVVTASFTKSEMANTVVNVYSGSEEEKDDKAPKDDDRPRPCFFKRFQWEELVVEMISGVEGQEKNVALLNRLQFGTFFTLFNQGCSEEQFYKLLYLSMMMDWGKDQGGFKDRAGGVDDKQIPFLNYWPLYKEKPIIVSKFHFYRQNAALRSIYVGDTAPEKARKESQLEVPLELETNGLKWDRIDNEFEYFQLCGMNAEAERDPAVFVDHTKLHKMKNPESLYDYMKSYFEVAGGLFVSNAYSEYKSNRMAWDNTNNITILGPYRYDQEIRRIDELSMVNDLFQRLKITGYERDPDTGEPIRDAQGMRTPRPMRIEDIAETTNGEAMCHPKTPPEEDGFGNKNPPANKYHFIAIRQFPKLEKDNGKNLDEPEDFEWLDQIIEFFEPPQLGQQRFIGGPTKGPDNLCKPSFVERTKALIISSINKYDAAMRNTSKRRLRLTYTRSKTEVNKMGEETEVAQDDALSSASDSSQKLSDLLDRFDSKSFVIQSPDHSLTQPVSLVTTNGTTTEISAIATARGDFGVTDEPTPLNTSSRTFYGFHIPEFNVTTSSLSFSVGSNGITTNVGESTLNIIPPDQDYLMAHGMESIRRDYSSRRFNAAQRNYFGL